MQATDAIGLKPQEGPSVGRPWAKASALPYALADVSQCLAA